MRGVVVFVSDDVVLSDDSDGCEESDEAARGVVVFVSDDAPPASTCTPSAPAGVPCALAEAPFADSESLSTPAGSGPRLHDQQAARTGKCRRHAGQPQTDATYQFG